MALCVIFIRIFYYFFGTSKLLSCREPKKEKIWMGPMRHFFLLLVYLVVTYIDDNFHDLLFYTIAISTNKEANSNIPDRRLFVSYNCIERYPVRNEAIGIAA